MYCKPFPEGIRSKIPQPGRGPVRSLPGTGCMPCTNLRSRAKLQPQVLWIPSQEYHGFFFQQYPPKITKWIIWLVVYLSLWKILVKWDDYSQYMEKMFQTTNQSWNMFQQYSPKMTKLIQVTSQCSHAFWDMFLFWGRGWRGMNGKSMLILHADG